MDHVQVSTSPYKAAKSSIKRVWLIIAYDDDDNDETENNEKKYDEDHKNNEDGQHQAILQCFILMQKNLISMDFNEFCK